MHFGPLLDLWRDMVIILVKILPVLKFDLLCLRKILEMFFQQFY